MDRNSICRERGKRDRLVWSSSQLYMIDDFKAFSGNWGELGGAQAETQGLHGNLQCRPLCPLQDTGSLHLQGVFQLIPHQAQVPLLHMAASEGLPSSLHPDPGLCFKVKQPPMTFLRLCLGKDQHKVCDGSWPFLGPAG